MISEELKQKNFNLFLTKLRNIGIDLTNIDENLASKIANATFAINAENNCAYDGSMLHIVLRTLTPFALKINELLPENIRVDNNSIIKVCLLSHISKSEMFVKNDNQWEIEKRGIHYKYSPTNVALKMGARSILMSQNLGINFSNEEFEAMMILDRDDNDLQAKFYSNPLSIIIKASLLVKFFINPTLFCGIFS